MCKSHTLHHQSQDNMTALMHACKEEQDIFFASQKGNVEIVKLLLQHGADPNLTDKVSVKTTISCQLRRLEFWMHFWLLQSSHCCLYLALCFACGIMYQDKKTALMYACEKGNDEIIDLLLKRGADPNLADKVSSFWTKQSLEHIFCIIHFPFSSCLWIIRVQAKWLLLSKFSLAWLMMRPASIRITILRFFTCYLSTELIHRWMISAHVWICSSPRVPISTSLAK